MDLEVDSRPALLHALVLSTLQTTSEIPFPPEHRSSGTANCIRWKIGPCMTIKAYTQLVILGWNSDIVSVQLGRQ